MKEQAHPVDVIVGANIRRSRISQGASQEKLAEALGITFQQVQKYEKGANRVSASRLHQIASFFGMEIAEFFTGTDTIGVVESTVPALSSAAVRVAIDYQKIKSDRSRKAVHDLIKAVIGAPQEDDRVAN
jgi:transcriptional regulator with XRE-family HTH domain